MRLGILFALACLPLVLFSSFMQGMSAVMPQGALSPCRVKCKALVNGKKRGEQWGGEFFILEQRLTIRICGI